MNIFLAGATGAVGRTLIPKLIERGHTVTGTTRSPDKAGALRALGATPVVVDGLDREGVINAVKAVDPDIVVHQMTALSNLDDLRHFEQTFAMTNRLRTEGTDNILAAAREVGALPIVQSFAGWPYEPAGDMVKDRGRAADDQPAKAVAHLDRGDPPHRDGRAGRRRDGAALRRVLRAWHRARAGWRPVGDDPRPQVPDRRRRRRHVVAVPHRGRRVGHAGRDRAPRSRRDLQHLRRRTRTRARVPARDRDDRGAPSHRVTSRAGSLA